jgi:hypothetical protein
VSRELRAFSATIPAGTLQSAPGLFDMSFPTRVVDEIQVFVPSGPNGTVGFAFANAGTKVIPYNQGGFIVANNEVIPIVLTHQVTSGSWQLVGYNNGAFDHTIFVRFYLSLPQDFGATVDEQLTLADLSTGGFSGGVAADLTAVEAQSQAEAAFLPPIAIPIPNSVGGIVARPPARFPGQ